MNLRNKQAEQAAAHEKLKKKFKESEENNRGLQRLLALSQRQVRQHDRAIQDLNVRVADSHQRCYRLNKPQSPEPMGMSTRGALMVQRTPEKGGAPLTPKTGKRRGAPGMLRPHAEVDATAEMVRQINNENKSLKRELDASVARARAKETVIDKKEAEIARLKQVAERALVQRHKEQAAKRAEQEVAKQKLIDGFEKKLART